MANSKHYLNNQQIEEPRNWQDLEVLIDWSNERTSGKINIDKLEFVGDSAIIVIARMNQGLTGGVGYFEGEPYRIEIGDLSNPAFSFSGYLDFTDNPIVKACNIVEVSLKQVQSADWIEQVADSFSYRYLASNEYNGDGKIRDSDYVGVPYIINYIPDGVQLLLLSISTFMLTKELVESIKSIAQQTTELIAGVTPVQGVAGIIPVVAWSVGQIIKAVINLAITVAYAVGVVYALIKLTEQIVEQLVPLKRYHKGIPIRSLFQKSCDHLGLTLKSDLLDNLDRSSNKWVIIPSKGNKGGSPPTGADPATWVEVGHPTSIDGIDTFADAIRFVKNTFNADFRCKDGVFEIERKNFWENQSSWVMPNTFTNQEALRNETTVNSNEIIANYVIKWATDLQDQNTLDNQQGRVFQAVTSPIVVTNKPLINIKGLKEIDINMSLSVRKDGLTFLEEALKLFLEAADFLTGQLGKPQSFASLITSRVGSLLLSSHFLSIPKMVVMSGANLALDQRSLLSANKLWNDYHFIESFVTIDNINAQRVIYADKKIPFCMNDFVSLAENNFVEIETGEKAEIVSLDWKVEQNSATVTYKVSRVYDNNLKINILTS
jgi:hypothetical protein